MTARLALAFLAALLCVTAGAAGKVDASAATTLAPILRATDWLNGRPTAESLAGKVVLVDVFTFDCINCKNVTPNLRKLHAEGARDLAIVGVHAPETPYERVRAHVVSAVADQGIDWPVTIDNEMRVWNAYGVEYWPTELIFDKHGRLRKTVIGDSQDDAVDSTVEALRKET